MAVSAGGLSEYEQRRLRNLEENRRILGELGAVANIAPLPTSFRRPPAAKRTVRGVSMAKPKRQAGVGDKEAADGDDAAVARRLAEEEDGSRRRSSRLEGRPAPRYGIQCDGFGKDDSGEENWAPSGEDDGSESDGVGEGDDGESGDDLGDADGEDGQRRRRRRRRRRERAAAAAAGDGASQQRPSVFDRPKVEKNRPNHYGAVPGVAVGTLFETRIDACLAGLHRPTVAGIHGGPDGAYSIALSGGYQDDIDLGSHFTYTGEGGRDLKGTKANPKNLRTAPQTRDQCLTRNNAALVRSAEAGRPVRVIRGYKLRSEYAPPEGYYRYDGLYRVEKWWYITGMSGFGVYKFAFKRVPDQEAAPWEAEAAAPVYNFKTDYRPAPPETSATATAADADKEDTEAAGADGEDGEQPKPEAVVKSGGGGGSSKAAGKSRKRRINSQQAPVEVDFGDLVAAGEVQEAAEAAAAGVGCDSATSDSELEKKGSGDGEKPTPKDRKPARDPDGKKSRGRPRGNRQLPVPSEAPSEPTTQQLPPEVEAAAAAAVSVTLPDKKPSRGRQPGRKSTAASVDVQQPPQPGAAIEAIASPPRKRSRFFFED